MLERELKFYVPPASRAAVAQAMQDLGARPLPLHARYYDTDHSELAQARIALRLRKEDTQWVQTVKAPGPDEVTRLELNHERTEPTLDLSPYDGTAAGQALGALKHPLVLRYETVIHRLVTTVNSGDGHVELAYDVGHITAGSASMAVCEIEFEQVGGSIAHLFDVARQWQVSHGLILDFRSKAERGNALANRAPLVAPFEAEHWAADADSISTQADLLKALEARVIAAAGYSPSKADANSRATNG